MGGITGTLILRRVTKIVGDTQADEMDFFTSIAFVELKMFEENN